MIESNVIGLPLKGREDVRGSPIRGSDCGLASYSSGMRIPPELLFRDENVTPEGLHLLISTLTLIVLITSDSSKVPFS